MDDDDDDDVKEEERVIVVVVEEEKEEGEEDEDEGAKVGGDVVDRDKNEVDIDVDDRSSVVDVAEASSVMERPEVDVPSREDEKLDDCVASVEGFVTAVTLSGRVVTAANVVFTVVVTVTVGVDSSKMVLAPSEAAWSEMTIVWSGMLRNVATGAGIVSSTSTGIETRM